MTVPHQPAYDAIKAAVENSEDVATRAVAAFNALVATMQTAVDNSDSLSDDDTAELNSILDTATQTATILGPIVATPGAAMPETPPDPVSDGQPADSDANGAAS